MLCKITVRTCNEIEFLNVTLKSILVLSVWITVNVDVDYRIRWYYNALLYSSKTCLFLLQVGVLYLFSNLCCTVQYCTMFWKVFFIWLSLLFATRRFSYSSSLNNRRHVQGILQPVVLYLFHNALVVLYLFHNALVVLNLFHNALVVLFCFTMHWLCCICFTMHWLCCSV
jgi:hypothetical protein